MTALDAEWVRLVCAHCDPVLEAADVGFERQISHEADGAVSAILWEADPQRFAAAYPDSGIVESYGEGAWPHVSCIDFWLYVDHERQRAVLSVEGWDLPEIGIDLAGSPGLHAASIAQVLARILGVGRPPLPQ